MIKRKLIGGTGYHYGIADFNANADALKQRFRIRGERQCHPHTGLFKERGEVAILNLPTSTSSANSILSGGPVAAVRQVGSAV